jgi:hypothetical protein
MKLSDVMSAMNLAAYAEVGLVLFFAAFTAIALDVIRRGKKLEALARLPLEDESRASREEERS